MNIFTGSPKILPETTIGGNSSQKRSSGEESRVEVVNPSDTRIYATHNYNVNNNNAHVRYHHVTASASRSIHGDTCEKYNNSI